MEIAVKVILMMKRMITIEYDGTDASDVENVPFVIQVVNCKAPGGRGSGIWIRDQDQDHGWVLCDLTSFDIRPEA